MIKKKEKTAGNLDKRWGSQPGEPSALEGGESMAGLFLVHTFATAPYKPAHSLPGSVNCLWVVMELMDGGSRTNGSQPGEPSPLDSISHERAIFVSIGNT